MEGERWEGRAVSDTARVAHSQRRSGATLFAQRWLDPDRPCASLARAAAAACGDSFEGGTGGGASSSRSLLVSIRRCSAASYSSYGGSGSGSGGSSSSSRSKLHIHRRSACLHTSRMSRPLSPRAASPSRNRCSLGKCFAYRPKISHRPGASGAAKWMRTSKRERRAESRSVRRFVAAISVVSACASIPSSRRSSTESMRRDASCISREREPASASSSSRKRTHRPSRPHSSKRAASCCSALPYHFDISASSGTYTRGRPADTAAMRAAVVFPVPGGP
mmetsp:Transcript_38083/g.127452  ORF Transcript_38083/g.127452 Transcript_38083/m.127452 type:complete len:278 (-) Transcript_38083:1048-1881(-)